MSSNQELARREERAQQGVIQFAEELQAIRDGFLYPGAESDSLTVRAAWKSYCEARWGMSKGVVDTTIAALPVVRRRLETADGGRQAPTVGAAAAVARLPETVQDAILDNTDKQDDVKEKAKAVRKAAKKIEADEGREATDDELIAAAQSVKPTKRPKPKRKQSIFTKHLEAAYHEVQMAADYAQGDTLSDTENDYAWNRTAKIEYQIARIREKLYQPETVKDMDAELAELLGGDEA